VGSVQTPRTARSCPKAPPTRPEKMLRAPPRKVKCFSTSSTGIAVPAQRGGRAASASSAASGRETRPTTAVTPEEQRGAEAVALQRQLSMLGIQLPLDDVRERVRMAQQRLMLKLSADVAAERERPSTARRTADSTPRSQSGLQQQRKRPSTARARLERVFQAKGQNAPVLETALAPEFLSEDDDDSNFERVEDEHTSRCLPDDVLRAELDERLWKEDVDFEDTSAQLQHTDLMTGKESISPVPTEYSTLDWEEQGFEAAGSQEVTVHHGADVKGGGEAQQSTRAIVAVQIRERLWEHGSMWEWGNPNSSAAPSTSATQASSLKPNAASTRKNETSVQVAQVPRLALPPRHTGQGAVTCASLSARPATASAPSSSPRRPATARLLGKSSRPQSAVVGLSPRTNLREPMGIWAGPNTPGPGAYDVAERRTNGGNYYTKTSHGPRDSTT
jgi:hypothetical protein